MKLSAWIFICVAFIACSQTKKTTKNQSSFAKDTILTATQLTGNAERFVRTDSLLAESIKSNQQIISKLADKKNFWLDIIALVIQACALLTIYYAIQTIKNERSKRNMEFISSINKLMIEHPDLRNFKDFERLDLKNTIQDFSGKLTIKYPFHLKIIGPYDFTILNEIDIILNEKKESILTNQLFNSLNNSNPIEIKSYKEENLEIDIKSTGGIIMYANITDDKYSKIRAYCFFILNNFETVLESNNRNLIEGWNNYFKALYKNSSDFKMVVEDSISIKYRDQFTESFITKIEQLRKEALQNQ